MTKSITVVMYHYVRELKNSPYPGIKGLEFAGFKRQLDYLGDNYTIVAADDLIGHIKGESVLPNNACLLTFDDGYRDHYQYVLPELKKRNYAGCFFPPVRPIVDRSLLEVNAIHYILACCGDIKHLVEDLQNECKHFGISETELDDLWARTARPNRFDTAEVIFVKRLLQRELPRELRASITKTLFERYVVETEERFCEELYMSIDEVKELIAEGMYVGSHTYNHYWLSSVDQATQEAEIDKSIQFLGAVGSRTVDWIMCYPYGSYNMDTLDILRRKNCIAGLTTRVGVADFEKEDALELSRFDTNNFPQ